MSSTRCLKCGKPTLNGSRCLDCNRGFQRAARNPMYDTPEWRRIRRDTLVAHRADFGDWCPGFGVASHPSSDLTVDHVVPGSLAAGVQVLCRGCNARKRHVDTPSRRRRR